MVTMCVASSPKSLERRLIRSGSFCGGTFVQFMPVPGSASKIDASLKGVHDGVSLESVRFCKRYRVRFAGS